jgi:ABC-2 type transport system ATP-binding protein
MIGDVNVADEPLEAKRCFGYVPEHGHLYESFTPMEYLLFVGRMHGVEETLLKKRIRALLQFWTLAEDVGRKMNGFSKGQKQKVLLSAAVLHDPPVLLLDEPLTGLDAHAVLQLRAFLRTRASAGRTVFYSSHLMDAVEKVADLVIVLNRGEIVAQGPPNEVKESVGRDSLEGAFSHLTSTADPDIEAAALEAEAFA